MASITKKIMNRYKKITGKVPEATMVFDKGNVSDYAMEDLVEGLCLSTKT
jgi:hypothetical protein